MKVFLSGAAVAAFLACGVPAWSLTMTNPRAQPGTSATTPAFGQNQPGYDFSHPMADADNVPVRAEQKHDGISKSMNSARSTGSQTNRTAQNATAAPRSGHQADVD
jgi:hypothetical protein